MAKEPRTTMSGKEARYILKQNSVNLSWLAEQLNILPQSFVQHGFDLGIPLETLEYCIGQSMKANRPIFNYVKIMRAHADLAIRQILDNLKETQ